MEGTLFADTVIPRTAAGVPDPLSGRVVFLSIGMSNTLHEFDSFIDLAKADPQRSPKVVVVNGAQGGASADRIDTPDAPYWAYVDGQLSAAGANGAQVQAVWLNEAVADPTSVFPNDARALQDSLNAIVHILKKRFPNLWLVYLSSRIYAGYASSNLNPEPYAYDSAFSVKWLIQDQINGSLSVGPTSVPWLSWGPYLWADGLRARSDGLTWACSDFMADGTHPDAQGAAKVARALLDFVHTDATARIWYEHAGLIP